MEGPLKTRTSYWKASRTFKRENLARMQMLGKVESIFTGEERSEGENGVGSEASTPCPNED